MSIGGTLSYRTIKNIIVFKGEKLMYFYLITVDGQIYVFDIDTFNFLLFKKNFFTVFLINNKESTKFPHLFV